MRGVPERIIWKARGAALECSFVYKQASWPCQTTPRVRSRRFSHRQYDFPHDLALAHERQCFQIILNAISRHHVRLDTARLIHAKQLLLHSAYFFGLAISIIAELKSD